ncbi:MAG: tRNA modification GTPase [Chryseolinea sp.]
MNKYLFLVLCIIPMLSCFSQIHYEKGYFIDTDGTKVECLIKNIEWKNNPSRFDYKLSDNSEELKASTANVNEFVIYGAAKFVKATVNIDRSDQSVDGMSTKRNPEFQNETVFLRVITEGKADLFQLSDSKLEKYFFRVSESSIEQLVFKKYFIDVGKFGENNLFRQQLTVSLKCPGISLESMSSIRYNKTELAKLFITYNKCEGDIAADDHINVTQVSKKHWFNLTIRPGVEFSSFSIRNTNVNYLNMDFDNKIGFRLGMEAEFILPFNKNKWSIIIEPSYQHYKDGTINRGEHVNVRYNSIETPISIRHYFFLSDRSRIFVNAGLTLDYDMNSTIDFEKPSSSDLNISANLNYNFGTGYKFDRYSLELRYFTPRNLLNQYTYYQGAYNKVAIIVGYSLFRANGQ